MNPKTEKLLTKAEFLNKFYVEHNIVCSDVLDDKYEEYLLQFYGYAD